MATLEDIAKRLNVSKGTISKALNGASDVSESLRKTILETAVEMNYSRAQRKKHAKCLCVLVENMAYARPGDFGYDIILGFRKMAEASGFRVETVELTEAVQEEQTYDQFMLRNNYVGALVLGMSLCDKWLEQLKTSRTPAVLYDNYISGNLNTAFLGIDNREAMELILEHLAELGHRKIGYLSSALDSYVYQVRYRSFVDSVRKVDPEWSEECSGNSYHTSRCIQEHLPRLLKEGVTAIVCSHDILAQAAMLHCQELGLRVPEDISFVGFDDLPISAFTTPPLTTVRQDRQGLGRSAYYLISGLMNRTQVSSLLLHAQLIYRASTAAPHTPAPEEKV